MGEVRRVKLERMIEEDFGERCPDFAEGCACCEVWAAYDDLVKRHPDLSEEDLDMALHWLDRFAVGIDAYPQFDRIGSDD